MKKQLENIILYKGYELFHDECYYGLVACRLKGNKNFYETNHFKNMDKAKKYVDDELESRKNERLANVFLAEKEDENRYTIKVSKMPINIFHATRIPGNRTFSPFSIDGEAIVGEDYVCDIDNKNLVYSQNLSISGKHFHGLQCSLSGEDEKHEKIQKLCSQIAKLLIEVHKLNNV